MLSDLRSSPSLSPPEIVEPDESPALTVTIASEGADCVAHVSGELDIATRNILFQACLSQGHTSIVIDLAEVDFMDCGGYGGIVAAGLVLQERGGSLTLRNQTGQPAHLLDLLSPTNLAAGPVPECPVATVGNEGRRRPSRGDSQTPAEYRYRLTDDSGAAAVNGSAATRGEYRARVRTTDALSATGSIRQVCTVRHPVDRS